MSLWQVLGTGSFALEVFEWAQDAGFSYNQFDGFIGPAGGVAPRITGLKSVNDDECDFVRGHQVINAIATPSFKASVLPKLTARGAQFATVIHPSATVKTATIGTGTIICPMCVIGPHCRLGTFVTLNYHTGIGHESQVGSYSTTAPGVQIGGNTTIGDSCYFAMNSTVIDRVKIGSGCSINAGSIVIGRIADGQKVSGNPARRTDTF